MTRFLERLARRALQVPPQVRVAAEPGLPAEPAEGPWAELLAADVSGDPPVSAAAAPASPVTGREAAPHAVQPPATPPGLLENFQPLVRAAHRPGLADAPLPVPRGPARLATTEAPDAAGPAGPRGDPGESPASAPVPAHAAVVRVPATPHRVLEAPVPAARRGGAMVDAADAADAPPPPRMIRRANGASDLPAAPELGHPALEPDLPVVPGRPARLPAPERSRTQAAQPARSARDSRDTRGPRPAEEAATTVHVTIGRIEIAAVAPPPAPLRAPAPGARPLSLDDYLARRSRR